jgi:hypothetical protein
MTPPIPVNLAVEDAVTEALFTKVLGSIPTVYAIRTIYSRGGYGYLKKNINGFNNAAKGVPFLIGTDLDTYACPPDLIGDWLSHPRNPNLMIRVAVREAEAWVLADKEGLAQFLGIRPDLIPENVEGIADAKQQLVELARRARKKDVREDICPPVNSVRKVGPNYNARLSVFIHQHWSPDAARRRAGSLGRTIDRLVAFRPSWTQQI